MATIKPSCDPIIQSTVEPMSESCVESILDRADKAFPAWSRLTVRKRVSYLTSLKNLILRDFKELAQLIHEEHGKTIAEANAELTKGLETLEYAESALVLLCGSKIEVSTGVYCEEAYEPLGVVVSVCPFNFPMMVPFWTLPIALVTGNCIVVKPSEKVPKTMMRIFELSVEAGFPKDVFSLALGEADVVKKLITAPQVKAVTFVGSSPIAKIVGDTAQQHGKKAVCLGGANNHLVVLPDADIELAAQDIVNSFCGCSGQRCMAASVLCLVEGHQDSDIQHNPKSENANIMGQLLSKLVDIVNNITVSRLISQEATDVINNAVRRAKTDECCNVLVDGEVAKGETVKPSVIEVSDHLKGGNRHWLIDEELFGPVLGVVRCKNLDEAIELENNSKFGNGAVIYTQSGAKADYATRRFKAGMLGVNVGVPVPREPFSFGGNNYSNVTGHHDITGQDGINFFTRKRKVTTRWGSDKTIF